MRILRDLRLVAILLALLMLSSNVGAQEPERRLEQATATSEHEGVTGVLTHRLTKSQLKVWGAIMQIVLARDRQGQLVHPKQFGLYQQSDTSGHVIFRELSTQSSSFSSLGLCRVVRQAESPENAIPGMRINLDMKGQSRHADGFIPFAGPGTKEPRSARDYFERGLARNHAGDSNGAIEDFTNAIAMNSNMGAPKGVKHPKPGLYNKGQPGPYEKLLIIDKFNALAYYNIGTLLMDQGRLSEALDNFNKAIKSHPRFGRAFNNRGYVKHLMGDIDGATKDYDRSVQLDPKNPYAYFNRGIFRYRAQDFAGAIADYSRAIELNPRIAGVFHERGSAYLAQAKLDEAHRDFDRAVELDPGLVVAYGNRGLVRILQGRDAEAEADFAHYRQYVGDNRDTLERLVRKARESRLSSGVKPSGNLPVIVP